MCYHACSDLVSETSLQNRSFLKESFKYIKHSITFLKFSRSVNIVSNCVQNLNIFNQFTKLVIFVD